MKGEWGKVRERERGKWVERVKRGWGREVGG